jgi:antimicrobial peptide system SdpB family protein
MIEPIAELGNWARRWSAKDPFTNVYGFCRTLLALATAMTIASSPSYVLFSPVTGFPEVPRCGPGILAASLYCLMSPSRLELVRWLSVAVLLIVASGWRPRLTALPHAGVSFSFFASSTTFDGGDQITLVLTMLLVPLALVDPRKWHWQYGSLEKVSPAATLLAWSSVLMIRLQVAGVYFVSGISKLAQEEWANGTAMYYWLLTFGGAPRWVIVLLGKPIIVVAMTWGVVVLEVLLAAALILPRKVWRPLLYIAVSFHILIAVFFGLSSFSTAMIAALILYLHPADEPLSLKVFRQWPLWERISLRLSPGHREIVKLRESASTER